jgi:hypothetical protein
MYCAFDLRFKDCLKKIWAFKSQGSDQAFKAINTSRNYRKAKAWNLVILDFPDLQSSVFWVLAAER